MQTTGILQELRNALKKAISLDELWKVAKGEIKYQDFLEKSQGKKQQNAQPDKPSVEVPDDLVNFLHLMMTQEMLYCRAHLYQNPKVHHSRAQNLPAPGGPKT